MDVNVGRADRLVRVVAAVVLLVVALVIEMPTPLRVVLLVVAGVLGVTALAGRCPAYSIFGVSTCPLEQRAGRTPTGAPRDRA